MHRQWIMGTHIYMCVGVFYIQDSHLPLVMLISVGIARQQGDGCI